MLIFSINELNYVFSHYACLTLNYSCLYSAPRDRTVLSVLTGYPKN